MTTFANSGNVQPAQGGEVACASIAGGPFAAVDAYVSGGTPGVQLEFRLYATVGALRTRVAVAPYAGPPVGAAGQGTLLKWTVIGQPQATSPVIAGGTTYDLVVYGVTGAGTGILATLAGTNAFDAAVAQSAAVALPSNYGSTSIVTNVGCAQLADVGVDQAGLPGNVTFDVFASCGAGSVEALVGTGGSGGTDGKSDVVRDLPLPVATQYRLAVRETQGQRLSGNVTASLATYTEIVGGNITPGAITPGPQITTLRSVTPTAPTSVVWASTGYVDFVADCGADPTGVADCVPALDRAYALLSALAANPKLARTGVVLFIPPGIYTLKSVPGSVVWDFANKTTSVTIKGSGDSSIFQYMNGFTFIEIANAYRLHVCDLTHVGLANDLVTSDCTFCWVLAAAEVGVLERCKFFSVNAATAVVQLQTASWTVRDCAFDQSCNIDPTKAVLYSLSCPSIQLENCVFLDISTLNGYVFTSNKANLNNTWFRHDDSFALGSGYQQRLVRIVGCVFDENCVQNVWIQGGPTANVNYAYLEGCTFNPPILGLQRGCVVVDKVDVLEAESIIDTGFTATVTAPVFTLTNVNHAKLKKIVANPTTTSKTVTADGTVGALELIDSDTVTAVSTAQATVITPSGWAEPNSYQVALPGA